MEDNRYIKLAFIRFGAKAKKAYIFEYDKNIFLNEGDTVIVINSDGDEIEATVVETEGYDLTSHFDKEELNRLLLVAGVGMPFKKIKGKVTREYFKYEDEVSADENDD